MLRTATEIASFTLRTRDEEIGCIHDLYFDERRWRVCYFAVRTHSEHGSRMVVMSPSVISAPDWMQRVMTVAVSRDQVEQSPSFDPEQPFIRLAEVALARHYGWALSSACESDSRPLQSVQSALGTAVDATDGSAGKLVDFLVDDLTWEVRYLVVETGCWWSGKKVLIAPQWVDGIRAADRTVSVSLAREAIKESPAYEPADPVTPDHAGQLDPSSKGGA